VEIKNKGDELARELDTRFVTSLPPPCKKCGRALVRPRPPFLFFVCFFAVAPSAARRERRAIACLLSLSFYLLLNDSLCLMLFSCDTKKQEDEKTQVKI
jgi:hypothetical protein